MSKEKFIEAHQELMEEYMEKYPHVTFEQAYERTSDQVYIRYRDNWLALADDIRKTKQEEGSNGTLE